MKVSELIAHLDTCATKYGGSTCSCGRDDKSQEGGNPRNTKDETKS